MTKSKDPNTPTAFYWNEQEVASWIGGIGYPQYKVWIQSFSVTRSAENCDSKQIVISAKSISANIYQEFYKRKKACST